MPRDELIFGGGDLKWTLAEDSYPQTFVQFIPWVGQYGDIHYRHRTWSCSSQTEVPESRDLECQGLVAKSQIMIARLMDCSEQVA